MVLDGEGAATHPSPRSIVPLDDESIQEITAACAKPGGIVKALTSSVPRLAATPKDIIDSAARDWLAADPATAALLQEEDVRRAASNPAADSAAAPRSVFPAPDKKVQILRIPDSGVEGVVEGDGTLVKVYRDEKFVNWGRTVEAVPKFTFVPRTRNGVVAIVKFAARERLPVRCSGARHSWTPIFGADKGVLISFMELGEAVPLTDLGTPDVNVADRELEHIQVVSEGDGGEKAKIRVGSSTTSEHWRAWCLSAEGGKWRWMMPALPVLNEITVVGAMQSLCHGAGREHPCISDFVVGMEIVNVKGDIQHIEGDALKAAAGAMGLAGVVLSQTVAADPMKIAKLHPRKVPVLLSVPPVDGDDLPDGEVDFITAGFDDKEVKESEERFRKNCDAFYSEWFLFPFQDEVWENIWDTEDASLSTRPPEYLSEWEVKLQGLQISLLSIVESTVLRLLPGHVQAKLFGELTLAALPAEEEMRVSVCDALHFQRGIHNNRVQDIELEIEIPARGDGTPDFTIVQRAWWAGIRAIYAARERGIAPVRVALEMRIIGGSDSCLSTQRGATSGMCSIEVLTNTITPADEWTAFMQEITDAWAAVVNPATGQPLRILPHWAKQWPARIRGIPTQQHIQAELAPGVKQFKEELDKIAANGGYTKNEMFRMFGNRALLDILGEDSDALLGTSTEGQKKRKSWFEKLNCFSSD